MRDAGQQVALVLLQQFFHVVLFTTPASTNLLDAAKS
jgi:hypothetical protein